MCYCMLLYNLNNRIWVILHARTIGWGRRGGSHMLMKMQTNYSIILPWHRKNPTASRVCHSLHESLINGIWVQILRLNRKQINYVRKREMQWSTSRRTERFLLVVNTCLLVEQCDSSAAASNCVFSRGKSAFLACSHRTDVPWWRPEGRSVKRLQAV